MDRLARPVVRSPSNGAQESRTINVGSTTVVLGLRIPSRAASGEGGVEATSCAISRTGCRTDVMRGLKTLASGKSSMVTSEMSRGQESPKCSRRAHHADEHLIAADQDRADRLVLRQQPPARGECLRVTEMRRCG